ncbi:MAG TPA: hypothetical protein PKK15_18460 [Kouleothrix sp.]|uniref:hypothetical protein n=1 Tax=Kouleothrix sp. TaxID=2779161 RepID=UPI002C14A77A|nr:hypothetical protein [Kouleothrix sp.]
MAEKSYQDAVQVLKDRFGGRWEGAELDGRREMSKILREQLGFSDTDANETIDAMVASGQLRYHRAAEVGGPTPMPAPMAGPTEGIVTGVPASGGIVGAPLAPAMVPGGGYWEVGANDNAPIGRSGQVTPDGL